MRKVRMYTAALIMRGKRFKLALWATLLGLTAGTLVMIIVDSIATTKSLDLREVPLAFVSILAATVVFGFFGWLAGVALLVVPEASLKWRFPIPLLIGTFVGPLSVGIELALGGDSFWSEGALYACATVDAFLVTLIYLLLLRRNGGLRQTTAIVN